MLSNKAAQEQEGLSPCASDGTLPNKCNEGQSLVHKGNYRMTQSLHPKAVSNTGTVDQSFYAAETGDGSDTHGVRKAFPPSLIPPRGKPSAAMSDWLSQNPPKKRKTLYGGEVVLGPFCYMQSCIFEPKRFGTATPSIFHRDLQGSPMKRVMLQQGERQYEGPSQSRGRVFAPQLVVPNRVGTSASSTGLYREDRSKIPVREAVFDATRSTNAPT